MSLDVRDTPNSAAATAAAPYPDGAGRVEAGSGDGPFGNAEGAPGATAAGAATTGLFAHTPEFLLDVQINVSVEVGRIPLTVREVLSLGPGQVIELQRSASEPVEVHANGRCIGRGEIVVVGEQFGVRITELGPT